MHLVCISSLVGRIAFYLLRLCAALHQSRTQSFCHVLRDFDVVGGGVHGV